jgi:DNA-directed RNA polymerase specialized sigma24 family protein
MICQKTNCHKKAIYHAKDLGKFCYDHTMQKIGHSINEVTKCEDCKLLVPQISEVRQTQRLRVIETKCKYSGERSPYWDFLNAKQNTTDDGILQEQPRNNPDVLDERESVFFSSLGALQEHQLEIVQEVTQELSEVQRKVLYFYGQLGWTEQETADELGITQQAVHDVLQRIRRRIQTRYNEIKQKDENNW